MTFAAFDFLAGIKAAWAAGLGGLDRLAVDHTGRRAGLAALRPAGAPEENVVEPQPHLTGAPGIEVALHRSVGRKLFGQQTPLAAGLGQIEYRIDHRTYWRRAWPAALGRWGKLNCYHRPLAVGRIACITQPVPPILLLSDFSPCHAVLCRSSPPRQNHKLLKSLNRFTGQTLRKGSTRWGWRTNIAASWASRLIARPQCRQASLPTAWRLYLPGGWVKDRARRKKAGIPKDLRFRTKPQIALEQIRAAHAAGLPQGPVLMDAGYGKDTGLRTSLTDIGLAYVAGILPQTKVWAQGRRKPLAVEKLALALPAESWRIVQWREGTGKRLASRFARMRVRAAHRKALLAEDPRAQEWLLIEWPKGEKKPTKYMLTTLPNDLACSRLVDIDKLRWRIERDYQELKQHSGLGHFEG